MPIGIARNVLHEYKPDLSKREGYIVNCKSDNFKNKLHYTVNAIGLDDSDCLSSCLYMNADNAQEHPTTKLVSALANHRNSETPIYPMSEMPILTY